MYFILKTFLASSLLIFASAATIASGANKSPDGIISGQGQIAGEVRGVNRELSVQGNVIPGVNHNPPSGNAQAHFSIEKNGNSAGVGYSQGPNGHQTNQHVSLNIAKTDIAKADVSLSHSRTISDYGKQSENTATLKISDNKGSSGQVSVGHIPNQADYLSQKVNLNVLNTPDKAVNIEASHTYVKPNNQPIQQSVGGQVSFKWKNSEGFAKVDHKPQVKFTEFKAGAKTPLLNFPKGSMLEGNLKVASGDGFTDKSFGFFVSIPTSSRHTMEWKTPLKAPESAGFLNVPEYAGIHNLPQYSDRKLVFVAPDDARLDNDWYPTCGPACCKGKKFNFIWCLGG